MHATTQQNDEFLRAYEAYADAIFRHCYFRVYDRERARELMQECFMRTWSQIADGKEIKNVRAFLYRVANNLIIDESRKKKESSLDVLMDEGFEPANADHRRIVAGAEASQIMKLLDRVDGKYRDVIVMRYVDDMSPKEIAAVLGETENAVSVRIHRGIKQIREYLA